MTTGRETARAPAPTVLSAPGADWDALVQGHPEASIYHRAGWSLLARDVFGHQAFFIEARTEQGELVGVLPVVRQRGLLGDFATSIPFFNYGGALANADETALAMMNCARDHVCKLGCSYLELRDVRQRPGDWQVRTDKVSMLLDLPATADALSKQLGSKLRSQIKRADREAIVVRSGSVDLLDAFYAVFAENMRDLGTPVYPRKFFRTILERYCADTQLLVIEHQGRPSAAGFLVFDGRRAEIPWASCRAAAKPIGLNMKLYWELLTYSMERGCTSFDFGRSTVDSGTFKFKKQWGAQPLQLHWHRWERGGAKRMHGDSSPGTATKSGPSGRLMHVATAAWQRLPMPLANFLGPLVSPSLPW